MDKTFTQKKINTTFNLQTTNKQNNISNNGQQPGNDVINAILNYSKSLIVKQSKIIESIAVVIN